MKVLMRNFSSKKSLTLSNIEANLVSGVPAATANPVAVLNPPPPPPAPNDTPAPPPPATTRYSTVDVAGTTGVTELLAELVALVPTALVAVTVKVYAVPSPISQYFLSLVIIIEQL